MIHSNLSPIFHGNNGNVVAIKPYDSKNPHQGVNSKTKKIVMDEREAHESNKG
jgi:hypothetical protein